MTPPLLAEKECPAAPVTGASPRQAFRSVLQSHIFWLVIAALAVRLVFLFGLHTYRWAYHFDVTDDISFSNEITHIAASLARGHGFSSPFSDAYTGPSAWIAPVYPGLCALAFRLFGITTRNSYIFILGLQALFSALTVIPILGIGRRTVGPRAGLLGARLWIAVPWFSKWAVTWVWDMSLSALLYALLFWFALELEANPSRRRWIGFGALWGAALLTNPSLSTLLPISLAWCAYRLHCRREPWVRQAMLSGIICLLVISPWLARNRVVFGHWVFLRSNFLYEFALSNYHLSAGRGLGDFHPARNVEELSSYREMGEPAYVRWKGQQALQFVRDHPQEFTALTLKRVSYFWDGSSMIYRAHIPAYWVPWTYALFSLLLAPAFVIAYRSRLPAWILFFFGLALYPLPYYLTYSQARYRHAIEPIMALLIAYVCIQAAAKAAQLCRTARGSFHEQTLGRTAR